MVAGENALLDYEFKSSGGNHSQGGVGLSRVKRGGWPIGAPVLVERARSEGARSTRAVGAPTGHPPVKGGKSVEGA